MLHWHPDRKKQCLCSHFWGRQSLWAGKMLWNNLAVHHSQLLTVVSHFNFSSKTITDKTENKRKFLLMHFNVLTSLTSAIMGQSVAIVTLLTVGTGRAISVVQALEALTSSGVTWPGILRINVVVALARQTLPTGLLWVAVVTRGTLVTTRPYGAKGRKRWLSLTYIRIEWRIEYFTVISNIKWNS